MPSSSRRPPRSSARRSWRGLPAILLLSAFASAVSCQLSLVVAGRGGEDAGLALLLSSATGLATVVLLLLAFHVAGRSSRHLTAVPPHRDTAPRPRSAAVGLDEAWVQREAARGTRELDAWRRSQAS